MTPTDTALQAIHAGIDEVNEQLDPAARLPKAATTPLLGPGSPLDSLGLITFLAAVESHLRQTAGVRLPLATDDRLYAEPSPLATVSDFATFVAQLLESRR